LDILESLEMLKYGNAYPFRLCLILRFGAEI